MVMKLWDDKKKPNEKWKQKLKSWYKEILVQKEELLLQGWSKMKNEKYNWKKIHVNTFKMWCLL